MKELLSALALTACIAHHPPETPQPNDSKKSEKTVLAALNELGERLQAQADLVTSHVDRIPYRSDSTTCYPWDEYAPKAPILSRFWPGMNASPDVNFTAFNDLQSRTLLPASQTLQKQGSRRVITTLSVLPNGVSSCVVDGSKMPKTILGFDSQEENNPYRKMDPKELAYGYVDLMQFTYSSNAICAHGSIEARVLELRMHEPYKAIQSSELFNKPSRNREFALEWVTATCPSEGESMQDGEVPAHTNTLDWFNFRASEEEVAKAPGAHSTSTEHWAARVYALPNGLDHDPKVQWTYPNIAAVVAKEEKPDAAIFEVRDPKNSAVLDKAEAIFDAAWGPLDSLSKR